MKHNRPDRKGRVDAAWIPLKKKELYVTSFSLSPQERVGLKVENNICSEGECDGVRSR